MKNIEKMREMADNAQARADKRKFSLHVEEARQIEAAEKEIGQAPLAILPTLLDAARKPFLAALTPRLSPVAIDLLAREGHLTRPEADAAIQANADAKRAKRNPADAAPPAPAAKPSTSDDA